IIEDINKYQQITKCKKVELLNIKSELQHCSRKSRIILMELTNNHDTDDDDEHAQFFFTISSKNVDDFINESCGLQRVDHHISHLEYKSRSFKLILGRDVNCFE
ncbi:unnamed protein product, partial [Rotaria magnacalcarata]